MSRIVDEELIDKAGYRLYDRCRDCLTVSDMSIDLCSFGMREFFEQFVATWRCSRTPREKMLAINEVIHRWHWETVTGENVGRPGGVNVIEGSRKQVIAFLDRLTAGPEHDRWQGHLSTVRRRILEGKR